MSLAKKLLIPFFCALLIFPSFIFLHECGHYLAARALGMRVHFHAADISLDPGQQHPNKVSFSTADEITLIAGPLVNVVLMMVGFLWLYESRRRRMESAPTLQDWLATILAMNALRWIRCFFASPAHPQPGDEARISQILGWPPWFLPYALGIVCLIALVVIIRFHPRGSRLLPISCMISGAFIGAFLWLKCIGPRLFP